MPTLLVTPELGQTHDLLYMKALFRLSSKYRIISDWLPTADSRAYLLVCSAKLPTDASNIFLPKTVAVLAIALTSSRA